jgi:hypothetical protein
MALWTWALGAALAADSPGERQGYAELSAGLGMAHSEGTTPLNTLGFGLGRWLRPQWGLELALDTGVDLIWSGHTSRAADVGLRYRPHPHLELGASLGLHWVDNGAGEVEQALVSALADCEGEDCASGQSHVRGGAAELSLRSRWQRERLVWGVDWLSWRQPLWVRRAWASSGGDAEEQELKVRPAELPWELRIAQLNLGLRF